MMKKVIILMGFALSGCATMKGWVGLDDEKPKAKVADQPKAEVMIDGEKVVRFSENQNMPNVTNRQYRRMNRQRMEEEAELHAGAGSMWVMEGQGAYLFTQNKTRREGDILNVKVEGPAQKQIETKVSVIKKLLKQLEDEEKRAREFEQMKNDPKLAEGQQPAPGPDGKTPAPVAQRAPAEAAKEEKDEPIQIDTVSTRIVERQPDGNYRIKGQQPFMIGKREYKVLVTGMIRPEDFNDEGVSSNKILDPQYDVVSLRRKE
ncbi:MAG: hypothetical protein BroJett040_04430 [Oligoflexia bacterium]|nr:MAG: hypothetical protein BroJett040_04430 [Oligoflexia bacterium]